MTANLYVAPDGGGSPTIWRHNPDGNDVALLTRRGALVDEAFDRFAALITLRDQVAQLAAELTDFHVGHGDYLSAGKSLTAVLEGGGGAGPLDSAVPRALELVREWTQTDGRIVLVDAEVTEFRAQLVAAIRGEEL